MHPAMLTCGGETLYLEANSAGTTPRQSSRIPEQAQTCNCRSSAAVKTLFRQISRGAPGTHLRHAVSACIGIPALQLLSEQFTRICTRTLRSYLFCRGGSAVTRGFLEIR